MATKGTSNIRRGSKTANLKRPVKKPKTTKTAGKKSASTAVTIKPPDIRTIQFDLLGTAPYVGNKFSTRAKDQIRKTQEAGSQAFIKRKREPKNFHRNYEEAKYTSSKGWNGISALAFKAAMISACRICGFKMTQAKLAIFVVPEDFDKEDGTPLVKIIGKPEMHVGSARNESGVVDLRARPMWRKWGAKLTVRYDNDVLSISDVTNLLMRAGLQVGVGEGRPDSKKSLTGMGWGTFEIRGKGRNKAA